MTWAEYNTLRQFVLTMKGEASGLAKRSDREYKNAGHSSSPLGTGDEGWHLAFKLSGESDGIFYTAEKLSQLLEKFKIEGDK